MSIGLTALYNALGKESTITLATCAGKRVTIRPMSHIRRGSDLYFQTGENSLKMRQIAENPSVAIACGAFEIEGEAVPQGRPLDDPWFAETYRAKHPEPFARYSALPDEIVVKVTIRRVRQWQYVDGVPLLAEIEL
jgi:hypothetical protein